MLGKTTLQVLRNLPPGSRRVIDLGSDPGSVIFDIADVRGEIQEVEWFGLELNLLNFVVGDLFPLPFAEIRSERRHTVKEKYIGKPRNGDVSFKRS